MKSRFAIMLLTLILLGTLLASCGQTDAPASDFTSQSENQTEDQTSETQLEQETDSAETAAEEGNIFTNWLPSNVDQTMAETEKNPELERAIINYYEIPEEYWENTKYYYNYVDLNGDGAEEILAVVMGPYTSGSGGSSMLWLLPYADMSVNQSLTLINTPIIVTKDAINGREFGARGLIVQRSGGGAEAEFVLLTCSDGFYTEVSNGEVLKSLDDIEGTAIICNDLNADIESGNYLTFAQD